MTFGLIVFGVRIMADCRDFRKNWAADGISSSLAVPTNREGKETNRMIVRWQVGDWASAGEALPGRRDAVSVRPKETRKEASDFLQPKSQSRGSS